MIDVSVPTRISLWSGTGTVLVEPAVWSCITMWLPRCRTSTNPASVKIAQMSRPLKTRSLTNGHLDLGDVDLALEPLSDLRGRCSFKKQFDCFLQV